MNTRNNSAFYQAPSLFTFYQKGPFYMGIKLYNSLPPEIQDFSHNIKKFNTTNASGASLPESANGGQIDHRVVYCL